MDTEKTTPLVEPEPEDELDRLRVLCRQSGHKLNNHLTVILGQIDNDEPDFDAIELAATRCAVIAAKLVDSGGLIPHEPPYLDEPDEPDEPDDPA